MREAIKGTLLLIIAVSQTYVMVCEHGWLITICLIGVALVLVAIIILIAGFLK